ncbi:hypothetical protein SAMN05192569_1002219 [Parageobacillus thermantarcticus]|uniref:Uncharacterized protein n=1 Tax=Parageobacillus thermantarcticus TaxID=186116 RepID=A0A1I0SN56_9BACL|nr:hypothetical protein SAMN05192569_1002219 [Parageobacillus thermantarcticus]
MKGVGLAPFIFRKKKGENGRHSLTTNWNISRNNKECVE